MLSLQVFQVFLLLLNEIFYRQQIIVFLLDILGLLQQKLFFLLKIFWDGRQQKVSLNSFMTEADII